MSWFNDILASLRDSRTVLFAAFVVSLAMSIGPKYVPDYIPSVPSDWRWLPISALIFTGSLLAVTLISSMSRSLVIGAKATRAYFASRFLSDNEEILLQALADQPNTTMSLEKIYSEQLGMSKLEFFAIGEELEEKGLVTHYPGYPTDIHLTRAGRRHARASPFRKKNDKRP